MTPEELKKKRDAMGLKQEELAALLGKTRLTINRWENGDSIPPGAQKLLEMFFKDKMNQSHRLKNVTPDSIKNEPNGNPKEPDAHWINYSKPMMVPMVHIRAQAGFLSAWGDTEYIDELPKIPWEADQEYKGNYMCFEVTGDSMWNENSADSLFERDVLLCREIQRHHWKNRLHINTWKYFVIVHKEQGILVKQITEHDTERGTITLHSLNPYFEDQVIHLDDLLALYNVVDIKRSARR